MAGLTAADCSDLRAAALLHDLGRVNAQGDLGSPWALTAGYLGLRWLFRRGSGILFGFPAMPRRWPRRSRPI
jgi:hypothetical protein